MSARFLVGDVHDRLRELPDGSVDLVLSSPPFLALRSYLPADHPDKAREIGSEPTPGAFIDTLLDVVEECRRVLAPHGTLCFELGDTYSGSGGAGGDYNEGGLRDGQTRFDGSNKRSRSGWHRLGARADQDDQPPNYRKDGTVSESFTPNGGPGWPEAKSLCLIPESFRWALAYDRNPFTGRTTPTWRVRNVVRWCRPNPPVGALGDKFRPATSEMVVACTSRTRWFDLDAVRTEHQRDSSDNLRHGLGDGDETGRRYNHGKDAFANGGNPAGAPPLDWWKISTEPYAGSHYATWPAELCVRPIAAMCPLRVCTVCGEPSRRIVEVDRCAPKDDATRVKATGRLNGHDQPPEVGWQMAHTTTGWTDCGHESWRRGVVLDPFAGSGTTLAVATGHGRDAIGIDLDARNADLARQRVGMFLDVDGDEDRRIEDVAGAGL